MKVLIISFAKLKYMPYMYFYLDNIDATRNEIHLVYWNRDGGPDKETDSRIHLHEFKCYLEDDKPKMQKIMAFAKYKRFVGGIMSEIDFDFVIALHTFPAMLMYKHLTGQYKGKYIFDYRDYTYEKIALYRNIVAGLVNCSAYTFISSDAFRKYLPDKDKLKTTHNILMDSLDNRNIRKPGKDIIRIRYWGLIRYSKTQIEIIKHIGNDPRFEFHFNGREQDECLIIKEYVRENGIKNVFFHGEYLPENRFEFIKDTDVIQNIQDFDAVTENAVSNKFYDSALFYIPQICSDKSYMGKCVEEYGIGFSCSAYNDCFADLLYEKYNSMDRQKFRINCDAFVAKATGEYRENMDILHKIFE